MRSIFDPAARCSNRRAVCWLPGRGGPRRQADRLPDFQQQVKTPASRWGISAESAQGSNPGYWGFGKIGVPGGDGMAVAVEPAALMDPRETGIAPARVDREASGCPLPQQRQPVRAVSVVHCRPPVLFHAKRDVSNRSQSELSWEESNLFGQETKFYYR